MSFTKKLNTFLFEAKIKNVIDDNAHQKLQNFAKSYENKTGINAFINVVGFLGGLTILLGLILIISHNWSSIPNIIKISAYLVTLAGFHFVACLVNKNHAKISQILHFIGAGYVLAGIGLIAQIYHLSSEDGTSFLMWFVMILPLVFILKHKWIGVMAVFSFYTWLTINSAHSGHFESAKNIAIYFSTISISLILIPRVIGSFNDCFDNVKFFGAGLLLLIVMLMGFSHDLWPKNEVKEVSLHPITIAILVLNLLTLAYLLIQRHHKDCGAFYSKHLSLLLIVINLLPLIINRDHLIAVSIMYWIIWFSFGAIMVYQGIIKENKYSITLGSWCIVIGLITRFLDIIGTMLFTGSMFILFGILLVVTAYFGERYRKYLINKIPHSHAS